MKKAIYILVILNLIIIGARRAVAQATTAFTYQGQLRDTNSNAGNSYTMMFGLYDALTGGNQIGSTITQNVTVTNGLFNVTLDFGANAFNGFARWMDITVQSGSDVEELSPRVQVLATPYAQYANAANQISALVETFQNTGPTTSNLVQADAWNLEAMADTTHSFAISDNGAPQMIVYTNGQGASFASNVYAGGIFYGGGSGLINSAVPQFQVFNTPGTNLFIVPANVYRIMVEVWGGGGGGGNPFQYLPSTGMQPHYATGSGGGGGGYGKEVFSVTPGTTNIVIVGAGGGPDQNGATSSVSDGSGNPVIAATGGLTQTTNYVYDPQDSSTFDVSHAGNGGISSAPINITGGTGRSVDGENVNNGSGSPYGGSPDGGSAAFGGSGGKGDYINLYEQELGGSSDGAQPGQSPGGGGGGGIVLYFSNTAQLILDTAASGANGRVIIYY